MLRTLGLVALALGLGMGGGLLGARLCGQPTSVLVQFSSTAQPGDIRVYVTGAVMHPGVYPLRPGDRVVDAVESAGGPAPNADTESINFATRIQDQDEIHVPRIGEAAATPAAATAPAGEALPRIDINHADAGQLVNLPGIGTTRAAKIVASRDQQGPFKQTQDLVQRKLVTQKMFDGLKDLIQVTPP